MIVSIKPVRFKVSDKLLGITGQTACWGILDLQLNTFFRGEHIRTIIKNPGGRWCYLDNQKSTDYEIEMLTQVYWKELQKGIPIQVQRNE